MALLFGLSSPVINWLFYYFVKGNFHGGFDLPVREKSFNKEFTSFSGLNDRELRKILLR